jgi:hypothetical protein
MHAALDLTGEFAVRVVYDEDVEFLPSADQPTEVREQRRLVPPAPGASGIDFPFTRRGRTPPNTVSEPVSSTPIIDGSIRKRGWRPST